MSDNLKQRIDFVGLQIDRIKSSLARRDLKKMHRALTEQYGQLNRESVVCRQLHKNTIRYTELEKECYVLLNNLDQHLVFAALLNS